MLRRSAPALLCLFVCLLAAHLSSASSALRVDQSRIRVSLDESQTRVTLAVENGTGSAFAAHVRLELLDPRDKVRASAAADVQVRRGANSFSVPLDLPFSALTESERKEFPWYRLRYRVAPAAEAGGVAALEGVVSLSEAMPDLFELRVVSPSKARGGSTLRARVRTDNPATGRPVRGVSVAGELRLDSDSGGKKPGALKAEGTTDADGFAVLDFRLPAGVESDDDIDLRVTARRGALVEEAKASVSVEEQPRVLLTTDKSLYQPGQILHMRALVFDPMEHALEGEEVSFELDDEDQTTVFRKELKTSRFGVASADWQIPDNTRLGTYFLKLKMEGAKYDEDFDAATSVKISRYDLPNFAVTAKPDRPYYLAGQNAEVEVRGDYLFGQPVKLAHVRVVRQTERRWNYAEQKYETEEHDAAEGETDEQGRFLARVDLAAEHKELAGEDYRRFSDLDFAAYVTDPTTRRTEQRRFTLRLTKDPIHLYVAEGRYRQAKGLPLAFYVSTFYADGTPAECEVSVFEQGTTRVVSAPGQARQEVKEPEREIVRVRTNRYGVAKVTGPAVSQDEARGNLSLRFVARDREGRAGHFSDDFWLADTSKGAVIRVETDKTLYRDGDDVAVELTATRPRMAVVVDASSGGRVISSKTVRLEGGRASLVIPYSPEFRDALVISATEADPRGNDDEDYGVGARTVVYPRDRELKLDVRLSQKSYRPGDEAGAELSVREAGGRRPLSALGVVVFDKAVEERAHTDEEFSRDFGFGDCLYGFWYDTSNIAGVTQRDIEQLDLSRPVPDGLEEVAEMIYNDSRYYDDHSVASGTRFLRDQQGVFSELVGAQLKPLKEAINKRYSASGEYPTDEASLSSILKAAGVDLSNLRDPWGRPYRAQFSVERGQDVLELLSDGADERAGTDDDFAAARFSWPYFSAVGERINLAAADYHKRTGGYVRDLQTLAEEMRREGFDLDALRDRWGQPYRFDFRVSGGDYLIVVESGGPDKAFEPFEASDSDDFRLWTSVTDYFAESRAAIDAALAAHLRETGRFPQTEESLRGALSKAGINFDSLRDGWGRRPYAAFMTETRYADRITLEARGQYNAGDAKQRTEVEPVTQTVYVARISSAGRDGKPGTADDFDLGYFTSVAAEQAAADPAPQKSEPVTTFSGGKGAISGRVTDPNGAVVAGVNVSATHKTAEVQFEAKTNDEGVYLLRNLPSGFYTLRFQAAGFKDAVLENVQVLSLNLTSVNMTLEAGNVAETVEVTAGNTSVQTQTSQSAARVVSKSFSVSPPPVSTPRLRKFFPETLVWQPALETDSRGRARLDFKLADNITTWKMSVIASTEDGRLGTAEKEFVSFQPFFAEHDPPRILTEGDRIQLPVVLRNYLERAQTVSVGLKPEDWFTIDGPARQSAEVPAGQAARPVFDFRVVASVKDGLQRVTATGGDASDAVEKPVTVHPDGEERSQTDATVFAGDGALTVNVPSDAIRGSVRSELKVYPNLTAHLAEGVEAIMERPYGCGEQTISSTYPSVMLLDLYQRQHGNLEGELPPVVERARRYARDGYERLLGYRAPGGGFTYWGRGDPDLALTAYALRFLDDASRVIDVDDDLIEQTSDWLTRQQRADGSWPARNWWNGGEDTRNTALTTAFIARVLASAQREEEEAASKSSANTSATSNTPTASNTSAAKDGAAAKETQPADGNAAANQTAGATPTPVVKVADAKATPDSKAAAKAPTPLERALRYLSARTEEMDEPYLIASYALACLDAGDREGAARAVARLRALAHEEGAGTYWALETNTPFYGWGRAGRVETTALAVRALNAYCGMRNSDCGLENKPTSNPQSAIPIPQLVDRGLLFLLHNQDRYGVWYSTQATVNVLDALLELVAVADAEHTHAPAAPRPSAVAQPAAQSGGAEHADEESAEVFVNGRRVGALALPAADRLSAPVSFDLSPFVAAGDNRVELRRAGRASRAQAQLVTTFYVPWPKPGAGEAARQNITDDRKQNGAQSERQNGASKLRLSVAYDRASASVGEDVTCSVEAERIGHSGYGMMLAEVGLPPGAEVDRASLERTMKESGWAINSYDLLPDRLVVYLWPAGGGTRFNFKFRPRYGLDALTAPSQLYDYYNPEARAVVAPTRFVIR
jgi:A-macroglobulin TED domain/Alpha-2-macroglobulin family/Carboxypeptidase regulatory-like domain/MG2 domain/A-macroglobulin receptor binding domain/Macroglobulin domain MG3/Type II secretion system (T2SS), protein G